MRNDRSRFELESLSNEMFAPLSEKEASMVVGGVAADRVVGICGYECTITWSNGTTSDDFIVVDVITMD